MATFNPGVPDVPESYWLHYSKPISGPEGDKSKGLAITTAGQSIEDLAKGADTVVKKTIEDEVYDKASAKRNEFSTQLAQADELVRQKPELITDDGITVNKQPNELKGLGGTLSMLDNARANGKLSPTNYRAQLDTMASDLRSRFPGYKQFIDSQFEKVTGMNPANALIESRIADINSFQTKINENQNKVLTFIGTHANLPGSDLVAQKAQAGQFNMSQAIAWAGPYVQAEHNLKMNTAKLENEKLDEGQKKTLAVREIGDYSAGYGAAHLNGIMISAGLEHPTRIADYIEGIQKGKIPLPDPKTIDALTGMVTADRAATLKEMKKRWYTPDPETKRTPASYIGNPEEVNKHLEAGLITHDTVLSLIKDKETGFAAALPRIAQALTDKTNYDLFTSTAKANPNDPNSKPLGAMMRTIAVGSKIGGPNVGASTFSQMLGMGLGTVMGTATTQIALELTTPKDITQGATYYTPGATPPPGAPPGWKPTAQTAWPTSSVAPPPVTPVQRNAPTMNEAVSGAIEKGIPKQGIKLITNLPLIVSDPRQPDAKKLEIVKNTFSRDNIPLLNNFVRENRDPDTGNVSHGQYTTFRTYGSIAPDIVKLDKAHPEANVLGNYKNWMENSFSHVLFPSEMKDLSAYKALGNVDFQYDGDNHKIAIKWPMGTEQGPGLSPTSDPTFRKYAMPQIQASIDRLNSGLSTMTNLAKSIPGMDVNSYIYQLFAANRVEGTIPDQILKAITNSRPDMIKKYTDELEAAGSLQQFLKDPGRSVPKSKNNASAASARSPTPMNLGEVLGVKVDNIPNGMTAKEFLRLLKERGQ